jgi:predicted DNA-binding antitoxin AbrB/MazE fold protein
MVHNIDAIYDHGVFRPIEPLAMPEGARVRLRVEDEKNGAEQPTVKPAGGQLPTLLERLKDFVGVIDDLPEDSSTNLDHYLYGTPKR